MEAATRTGQWAHTHGACHAPAPLTSQSSISARSPWGVLRAVRSPAKGIIEGGR